MIFQGFWPKIGVISPILLPIWRGAGVVERQDRRGCLSGLRQADQPVDVEEVQRLD